jgi:hypothetical protein
MDLSNFTSFDIFFNFNQLTVFKNSIFQLMEYFMDSIELSLLNEIFHMFVSVTVKVD